MRLIDADALLEALKNVDSEGGYDVDSIKDIITNAPTVQREPVNEWYPLIRLGYGLVEVGTGEVDGEPVVMFTNHGNGVIGDNTVEEPRVNDPKDVYAAISITNLDSLNVVRKQLDIFASKYLNEAAPTVQCQGWVSVPIEPTEEMLRAGCEAGLDFKTLMDDTPYSTDLAAYKAMISAAPTLKEKG